MTTETLDKKLGVKKGKEETPFKKRLKDGIRAGSIASGLILGLVVVCSIFFFDDAKNISTKQIFDFAGILAIVFSFCLIGSLFGDREESDNSTGRFINTGRNSYTPRRSNHNYGSSSIGTCSSPSSFNRLTSVTSSYSSYGSSVNLNRSYSSPTNYRR